MCIENNSVSNDNVSNIMSQFDFTVFVYLRNFHFRVKVKVWRVKVRVRPTLLVLVSKI